MKDTGVSDIKNLSDELENIAKARVLDNGKYTIINRIVFLFLVISRLFYICMQSFI